MKRKITSWSKAFFIMLIIEMLVFAVLSFCEIKCGISMGWNFSENNDAFYAILSISFIVSSLTSILAERNMPIYWSDVKYEMLVRPKYTNITALVGYICATIVSATVINYLKPDYLIWCLLITILMLILLTSKTIMSHFSRNIVKSALKKEFGKNKSSKDDLIDITFRFIDENQIAYSIENIELLMENGEQETVNRLLQYASDVNPFLFYKIVSTLKISCAEMLYETAIRLIDNDISGTLMVVLDEFIRQKSDAYFKQYIDGISLIERAKDGNVEFWQFDKARNQLYTFLDDVNKKIESDYYGISNLMIYALIKNNFSAFIHIMHISMSVREDLQNEYKTVMRGRYADDQVMKNLLGFFEAKIENIDMLSLNSEKKLNEMRFHIIRAIKAHIISNGQLVEILEKLYKLWCEEIAAVAKEESYHIADPVKVPDLIELARMRRENQNKE